MAQKQTRRAVSLKAETYQRVKDWCDAYKISMSSFVEERVADFFNNTPRTAATVQQKEGTWTLSASKDDMYPGSDVPKEKPQQTKKPPLTGGGLHEL